MTEHGDMRHSRTLRFHLLQQTPHTSLASTCSCITTLFLKVSPPHSSYAALRLPPTAQLSLGLPMLRFGAQRLASLFQTLVLSGSGPRAAMLRQRHFQYGFKYWVVCTAALVFVLGLAANPTASFMRRYPMLYAYIATVVSMTDRVRV